MLAFLIIVSAGATFTVQQKTMCRSTKTKLELAHGFEFGFDEVLDQKYSNAVDAHCGYAICEDRRVRQMAYQTKQSKERFNATAFLDMLKGQTLLVIGDSLGEQLYQHLVVDLLPFQISVNEGNGTHDFFSYENGTPKRSIYPQSFAAIRTYGLYNSNDTTVLWCRDAMPEPWLNRDVDDFCTHPFLRRATILLVCAGAHFKPPDNAVSLATYYDSVTRQGENLESRFSQFRAWLTKDRLSPVIIWRLDSHVGPIDEYNALFYKLGGRDYRGSVLNTHYNTLKQWDHHFNRTAGWQQQFNAIKRAFAHGHGDYVLAHDSVSEQLLKFETDRVMLLALALNKTEDFDYFIKERIKIHIDSLHYCAGGGNFRAALLLLQKIVAHHSRCSAHHH